MPTTTISLSERLDGIARWILIGLFAIIPFFFFPVPWLTALQSKLIVVSAALAAVAVLWTVARIVEGRVRLPWSMAVGSAALLPLVYAISAAVNGFASISLVGTGIETDTLAIICVEFSALALTAMLFIGQHGATTRVIRALFIGLLVLEVIHILHIIAPSWTFGGVLAGKTGNALGSWHEFSMIIGLALVMSIALIRSSAAGGVWKWVIAAVGVIALPILAIANFMDVWIAVGVASVILGLVRYYQMRAQSVLASLKSDWFVAAVIVIALLGATLGARFVSLLPERISVVQVEVRPSWQGTFQIGEQSLKNPKSFIFGVGPNTFVRQWGLHKPIEVNQTPFWNADFNVGVAPIPTSFISLGLIGVIAWLTFILAVVLLVVRLWITRHETALSARLLALSLGLGYVLCFHLSSVPGTSLGLLMFMMLGILVASLTPVYLKERTVLIAGGDAKNAAILGAAGLIALIALLSSIGVFRAIAADALINRAIVHYNQTQNLQDASDLITTSLTIQPSNDRAHRAAVELGLLKLQQLIAAKDPNQEQARAALQQTLEATIQHGLSAVQINGTDYQNWLQLASLYAQLAGAQIQGAYDNARAAYTRAKEENPTSPIPLLNLGQLDAIQGNYDSALKNLGEAVALKPDYAAAFYLASQIYVAKNDPNNALIAAARAAQLAPNDPLAWYNAGAIAFAAGGYQDAALATQQALALQPQYANAMYILGLSLYKLDRSADAISVFEALNKLDPGQSLVNQILANLKSGTPLEQIGATPTNAR